MLSLPITDLQVNTEEGGFTSAELYFHEKYKRFHLFNVSQHTDLTHLATTALAALPYSRPDWEYLTEPQPKPP